ncbi:hypothetical protein NKJ40_01105 [Mesorhizobium sp. M0119]|uniref:hypothetical protein n=1 Tax=unclassified Mesorhizobium TaxID=325217 RepID=UPI00333E0209
MAEFRHRRRADRRRDGQCSRRDGQLVFVTYANGRIRSVKAVEENTAAAALNVNGSGAKSIRKMLSAGESALPV